MAELTEQTLANLVELSRATGVPKTAEGANLPYAVIPNTCKVEDLTKFVHNDFNERPHRKKGIVKVLDAPSFWEYFKLFQDANSRIYADETANRFVAVIDHHEAGTGGPRWGQHRVDLTLRYSEEWNVWKAKDGQKQTQMEFAEFIEDNTPDIVRPDAATMLEVARDLSAKSEVDFGSAVRMANGSVQFKYSEQVKGSFGNGNVDVPERFTVAIPVYIGTGRIELTARLRYRINSGKLTFWYDLLRADQAERDGFYSIHAYIQDTSQVQIINGVPA